MQAESQFSLKDQLFNADKVHYLSGLIAAAYPAFDADGYAQTVLPAFPELELKARIQHMAESLVTFLPDDFTTSADIIERALPEALDPTKTDDDFGDFIFAPLSEYVVLQGCNAKHLQRSLELLTALTKRFSVEFAIRPFINAFPVEVMAYLYTCAQDANYHVRRLASEGCRPKLPWGVGINIDYRSTLPILDLLAADPTRFVTRSVANHLNDISKKDPKFVVQVLQRWQNESSQTDKELAYMTRHALRGLVKQGDKAALELLGFTSQPKIKLQEFSVVSDTIKVGQACEFNVAFESLQQQKLMIDYVLEFASGTTQQRVSRKVFKLKQLQVKSGEHVTLNKKHPFKMMTTRKLALGEHTIILQINGIKMASASFALIA